MLPNLTESYSQGGPYGVTFWYFLRDFKNLFIKDLLELWKESEEDLRQHLLVGLQVASDELNKNTDTRVSSLVDKWPDGVLINDNKQEKSEQRIEQLKQYLKLCNENAMNSKFEDLLKALIWPYLFIKKSNGQALTWLPPAFQSIPKNNPKNLNDVVQLPFPSLAFAAQTENDQIILKKLFQLGSLSNNPKNKGIGHTQDNWRDIGRGDFFFDDKLIDLEINSQFSNLYYLNQSAFYSKLRQNADSDEKARIVLCSPLGNLNEVLKLESNTLIQDLIIETWELLNGPEFMEEVLDNLHRTNEILLPAKRVEVFLSILSGRAHFVNNLVTKSDVLNSGDLEKVKDTLRLFMLIERSSNCRAYMAKSALIDTTEGDDLAKKKFISFPLFNKGFDKILINLLPFADYKRESFDELIKVKVKGDPKEVNVMVLALIYELMTNAVKSDVLSICEIGFKEKNEQNEQDFSVSIKTKECYPEDVKAIMGKLTNKDIREETGLDHIASLIETLEASASWEIYPKVDEKLIKDEKIIIAEYDPSENSWSNCSSKKIELNHDCYCLSVSIKSN